MRNRQIFSPGLMVILALSLLNPTSSRSQVLDSGEKKGINLPGLWEARAGLEVQADFNDNINFNPKNKESDLIFHLRPSLSLENPLFQRGKVKIGYNGNFAHYNRNMENNWQADKFDFTLDYKAPGGLIVEFTDSFTDTEDPYGTANEYGEGQEKKRWSNAFNSRVGFDFGNRLKIFALLHYFKQDYEDDLLDWSQDYKSLERGFALHLRIMPKTWFFSRYYKGETDYYTASPASTGVAVNEANDADFFWKRVNIGLTTDPTSKLQGELNFGYTWKEYSNNLDPYGNSYDDQNTWIAKTNIRYHKSPKTNFSLSILRGLWDSGSDSSQFYESLEFKGAVTHRLRNKLEFETEAGIRLNDYNTPLTGPQRSDEIYRVQVGLIWRLNKWFSGAFRYNYTEKDSNYPVNSYQINRFIFAFTGSL